MITQLVFEHALRIRVKAETEKGPSEKTAPVSKGPPTPVPESPAEGTYVVSTPDEDGNPSNDTTAMSTQSTSDATVRASSSSLESTSSKGSKQSQSKNEEESPAGTSSANNLVGRINNLVATDLGNIIDARDLMFVLVYIPLSIVLCVVFLYIVLGWRYVCALINRTKTN
jgi:hypothetical protein